VHDGAPRLSATAVHLRWAAKSGMGMHDITANLLERARHRSIYRRVFSIGDAALIRILLATPTKIKRPDMPN